MGEDYGKRSQELKAIQNRDHKLDRMEFYNI